MPDRPFNAPLPATNVPRTEPLSEIQEDLIMRHQRQHLFPRAAFVGLGAGLVAALFRAVLAGADTLRNDLIAWSQQFSLWGWIFPLMFSMTGALLSLVLVIRLAPETSGSGIPHLKAVLHRLRTLKWARVLPVKFVADIVARLLSGDLPVFIVPNYPAPPMASLPIFALLGLFAGLLGVVFNRGLLVTLRLFDRFQGRFKLGIAVAIGSIIGMVGWFFPLAIGGGQSLAVSVLAGKLAFSVIPLLFVTRFFLTIYSYGTGAAGGGFSHPCLHLVRCLASLSARSPTIAHRPSRLSPVSSPSSAWRRISLRLCVPP